ncbi:MAG: preQ(1) synthase [Pseudomonadota bacterium]
MSEIIEKTPRPGPSRELETFPNPHPGRDVVIRIHTPEFTCLCPKTDQPDFATIYIDYIPEERCVELKSLKLYFWSYREEGAFHEKVTGQILDDLVAALKPRYMRVCSDFNVRGGVYTNVVLEHRADGWEPAPAVAIPGTPAGVTGY